jgi:hypothetical protein
MDFYMEFQKCENSLFFGFKSLNGKNLCQSATEPSFKVIDSAEAGTQFRIEKLGVPNWLSFTG